MVDDVEAHRRLVEILLTGEGYDVELAPTGAEALEAIAYNRPDAIILDLALPDMHGLELIERLRHGGQEIPVLVVSGDTSPSARVADLRATEFLMKPYEVDALIEAVARLFDGRV
jgi:CheY-like chemotaxis protein